MKEIFSNHTRRHFIKQSTLASLALISLSSFNFKTRKPILKEGLVLQPDPNGYLDLPEGFSYKIISKSGTLMSDGLLVPGRPDGMGTFLDKIGNTIIVCNHEISPNKLEHSPYGSQNERLSQVNSEMLYDSGMGVNPGLGGTTTLIYDEANGVVTNQYMSLAGTYNNCAGGITPWGSWITCEEDVTRADGENILQDHGYVFEVPMDAEGLVVPSPIKSMGRFHHEAVAVDPISGCVYLTEDRHDGLFYRFVPNEKENLHAGGQLQVLSVRDRYKLDTRNWDGIKVQKNQALEVYWMDIDDVESPKDDLRYRGFEAGASRFARGEGIWMGKRELFFACTNGGPQNFGQIFRYKCSPYEGTEKEITNPPILDLYAESNDKTVLHMCDNLTVAPWGDLLLCEDNDSLNHIRGIDKKGEIYTFACNRVNSSELTGIVFSPSGKTLFVNVQENGETVAITGPWEKLAG
jgi:secreted PhoX family phosphatase